MRPAIRLLTFGHGTAGQAEITTLLRGAEVGLLVDVRRFPGSRRHPHVARDAMAQWLPLAGIAYRWEPRLGGRRRVDPAQRTPAAGPGPDPWWQVEAFRAYAAHTRTGEFRDAMAELLGGAAEAAAGGAGAGGGSPRHDPVPPTAGARTAVLCSETVWWRCHRRLISDVAVLLHGVPVEHLGHDGRLTPHLPAAGARVAEDGLRYDR